MKLKSHEFFVFPQLFYDFSWFYSPTPPDGKLLSLDTPVDNDTDMLSTEKHVLQK